MNYSEQCKIKFSNIRGGDIPDEEYFKLPGVSNSKLKLINPIEGGSPEKFQAGFPPYKYNPSLQLGTINV